MPSARREQCVGQELRGRTVFEVYTREAERVLNEALQKAVEHEGDWIVAGSEMIVLAMLDGPPDPDDLARRALDAHAVTADGFVGWLRVSSSEEARAEAKRVGTLPGPFSSPETNLCLRRALQLALEEGTRVGTEHLLLGVLYERDSFASIGLRELSFTYEDAFRTIELEKRDRRRVGAVAHEPPVLIPDPPAAHDAWSGRAAGAGPAGGRGRSGSQRTARDPPLPPRRGDGGRDRRPRGFGGPGPEVFRSLVPRPRSARPRVERAREGRLGIGRPRPSLPAAGLAPDCG
jgi:hypothetical protein